MSQPRLKRVMRWGLGGFYKQQGGYQQTIPNDWMYITCFDLKYYPDKFCGQNTGI